MVSIFIRKKSEPRMRTIRTDRISFERSRRNYHDCLADYGLHGSLTFAG